MGGLCSGPKDPEALTLDEVIHNTCAKKTCDGWIERKTAEETEWEYVGQGKGGFEQVHSFDFVGDGKGSYHRETICAKRDFHLVSAWDYVGEGNGSYSKDSKTHYHGWRCGSYGAACTACLCLVGFLVLLTGLVLPSADGAEAPTPAPPSRHSRLRAPPAMAEPYNCSSHYFNQPWTQSKALWCCAEHGVGCTTAPPPGRPGTSWMLLPVPMAPAGAPEGEPESAQGSGDWVTARSSFTTRGDMSAVTFDCSSDYGHWRTSWSSQKKQWCCNQEHKGCPFDCRHGFDQLYSWPLAKREWCCQRRPEWCTTASLPPSST